MLPLVWRARARADLREIAAYIADRNPGAANRLVARIEHAAQSLPAHPYLYRPGRAPGTREAVVHPNYILVYRVAEVIEIVNILHARQQYP